MRHEIPKNKRHPTNYYSVGKELVFLSKKQISSELKLQIVLEVLREDRLITDIAAEHGIHRSVVHRWKDQLLEGADKVFSQSKSEKQALQEKRQQEEAIESLYAQVGRLT